MRRTKTSGFARFWVVLLGLLLAAPAVAQNNGAQGNGVQTAWRLLDYIAVDYAGAVSGGKIISPAEYSEMSEFSASVGERIAALPPKPDKSGLVAASADLRSAIAKKAAPDDVAKLARGLGRDLLAAYPVPMGPTKVPDAALGAKLYAENCAACHGAAGAADTPMAKQLDPPPIAFTDHERAAQRTPFALYQVIDQGLEGTAMASFAHLTPQEKWALAFHVGRYAYPEKLQAAGKRLWGSDPDLRARIPDLDALSGLSEAALAKDIGADKAAAVVAFLRANPQAVMAQSSPLDTGRQRLAESLAAYQAGDRGRAKDLALAAYLDGFEPVEPLLATRNGELLAKVEAAMGELRAAIARGADAGEVGSRVAVIQGLFDEAEKALAPDQGTSASTFLGAFTILFREGLEALLIVVGMLAFLRKGGQSEMTRPVHIGWVTALIAGGLTWWVASSLIAISGASRELTEGFGSLLAAAVLLFVGIWMHGKAQANEWQRYIAEKMGHALSKKSAWFLFVLAFIAVYREVFETILFYAAMAQEHAGALVAGAVTGAVALAVIAVVMLRFSQRLPISKFFAYSSALVAVLAVVLAGKGMAALQEAGLVGVTPLSWIPRIQALGVYPTLQGISLQLATLLVLLAGFAWNQRETRRVATV